MVFVNVSDKDNIEGTRNIPDSIVADSDNKYVKAEIPQELRTVGEELFVPITEGEEFEKEEEHLEKVLYDIRYEINSIQSKPTFVDRYATVHGGDDGTEFAQLNSSKRMSQSDYRRIDELNNLAREPYRIRVDFRANNEVNTVYLGPVENKRFGIASIFDNLGKRLATYNPKDNEINDKISLRREFRIRQSILMDYKNMMGTVMETTDEFRDGLTDPFLISVFKARRAEREVRDIILTIQENQNKIVDADDKKNIVVQGCAGSGKTMVMMHRLSRLQNRRLNYELLFRF